MALECKIELSQTAGITVTVINSDKNITQTATFDGTTITHTVKGESATSSIAQTADGITVTCNNFTVNAESITCKSSKDSLHQAQGKFTVDATDTCTLKSAADMQVTAATKLNMKGADFAASADNTAKLTALTTTINGDQKANITGLELALSAQTAASLQGLTVKASAQTTMDVDGLTTTVKGQLTNIQGSLVKLG